MLKKINDKKYMYKQIDVKYKNGIYQTVIALPRYNNTSKIYELSSPTQQELIEKINTTISKHMFEQSKIL